MANDALFQMLAQSKSLPSHAYRTADAALQIPGEALGGYEEGMNAAQQIKQYQMLNTPLGQIWQDPSQIPYGLSPNHTVRDLMTIAPTMQNYIPSGFANTVAGAYGANTGGGLASSPTAPPPPPPQTPATPSQTPGASSLAAAGGAGGGTGGAFAPGSPTSIQASTPPPMVAPVSSPSQSGGPAITIPPGGISRNAMELLQPALKASQEERLAQQRLAQEEGNFQEAQSNENTRSANNITAGNNRTMAGETSKIAPSITEAGTINDDINALMPLYKGYSPTPFLGTTLAGIAAKSGSSTFGSPTMQTGKQIQQIVPALSAKVNYLLNKRFNAGEAGMLQQQVVPNASDDEANAMQKIGNLRRLTAVIQGGDINALQMVASSIAGQPVNPALPTSTGQAPSTQIPQGRIMVRRPDGSIGHIPQNQLQAALAQGYTTQ